MNNFFQCKMKNVNLKIMNIGNVALAANWNKISSKVLKYLK